MRFEKEGDSMSWFHSSSAVVDVRDPASPSEIVACFQDQRAFLGKLAFLITGDQRVADLALARACELTLRGNSPFRDWLLEWAKSATISGAILQSAEAIRACDAAYKSRRCTHVEHVWQGNAEERLASLDVVLAADAQRLIAELDALCRAVLVLRVAIRASIQDCALRLNVSRAAVLAANCHVVTWLQQQQVKPLEVSGIASHAP